MIKNQVSASIVLYNTSEKDVLGVVNSFLNATTHFKRVLWIIDHSPKDTLKRFCSQFQDTNYAHHPENLGYGAGHNIAIRKSIHTSKHHVVLNPDILFEPDTISTLFQKMEADSSVGLIMPKIVDKNGELQYLAKLIPAPYDLLNKRLPFLNSQKRLNQFQLKHANHNVAFIAPYLSGCFMYLRMSTLKEVGLFDERFFMYPEDIDLSRRIHQKYKTLYFPFATVVHLHEAASYKSWRMFKIHAWNMIKYFNKWGWIWDKERILVNKSILEQIKHLKAE